MTALFVFAFSVFAVIRVAIGLARSWHAFVTPHCRVRVAIRRAGSDGDHVAGVLDVVFQNVGDAEGRALRREGNSKEKSARIANAAAANSRSEVGARGGSSRNYEDWTKQELAARPRDVHQGPLNDDQAAADLGPAQPLTPRPRGRQDIFCYSG